MPSTVSSGLTTGTRLHGVLCGIPPPLLSPDTLACTLPKGHLH